MNQPVSLNNGNIHTRKVGLEARLQENYYDVSARTELAIILMQLENGYQAGVHANLILDQVKKAMLEELKTGKSDARYSLESLDRTGYNSLTTLFDGERRTEAESTFECICNLNELRKKTYDGVNWDDIREVLVNFTSVSDLATASRKILEIHEKQVQAGMGYITKDSIEFLKKCVKPQPGLSAEDVGEALEFYSDKKDVFNGADGQVSIENMVTFFAHVKRYDDELATVERYCSSRTIRHVVQFVRDEKLAYILGRMDAELSATQKVQSILDQNALKQFLGMEGYWGFMGKLLKGNGSDDSKSFFSKLCPQYVDQQQLDAISKFLETFEIRRLPIHEYQHPATTRNSNFIGDMQLGNEGILRLFIKFYENLGNAERERFFLMGEGKGVLEKHKVNTIPAIESMAIMFRDYTTNQDVQKDILVLGFIDVETLDEVVNNSVVSHPSVVFGESVRQLARIHNSTGDLEMAAGKAGITLFDIGPEYFYKDLQIQLERAVGCRAFEAALANSLLGAIKPLCGYLYHESEEDGVYYKDSNTRNIFDFVQNVPDPAEIPQDKPAVVLFDYECGVKIMGEVDVFKILRNGCHFDCYWDAGIDYKIDEWEEKSPMVEKFLADKRYLSREAEGPFVEIYNQERGKEYDDIARVRFDLAALYTHIWYVAWFSHKVKEPKKSDKQRQQIANRVTYHLVEAKLVLDEILHNKGVYSDSQLQLAGTLNLQKLRETLDGFKLVDGYRMVA